MVNFGPLAAEIGLLVWGTPANINGFRVLAALLHGTPAVGVLASLLQRHRSAEVNQTLHDVWLSSGLVHYIFVFGGSCPIT